MNVGSFQPLGLRESYLLVCATALPCVPIINHLLSNLFAFIKKSKFSAEQGPDRRGKVCDVRLQGAGVIRQREHICCHGLPTQRNHLATGGGKQHPFVGVGMTIWNAKKAGTLYEVISHHMSTLAESEFSPPLECLMLSAQKASCSFLTTDQELNAIRSGLCSYCIQKMQYQCKGHQFQLGCEFAETMLEARNSKFPAR